MNNNLQAFLRVIRAGESNQSDSAFSIVYGGDSFQSFERHPYEHLKTTEGGRAAGAYQIIPSTWDDFCQATGHGPNFDPEAQTECALWLIERRHTTQNIIDGDIPRALEKLKDEWVSLPGLGVPTATDIFRAYGGTLPGEQPAAPIEDHSIPAPTAGPAQPQRKEPMGAALFIPAILQLIPSLIGLFGKGGRAETNAKAAQMIVDTFTQAVPGAVNVQDAIERAQADPAVKAAATAAVMTNPVVESLLEISPSGIKEARAANLAYMQTVDKWWKPLVNPVLWVTGGLLPLVYKFVWELTPYLGKVSSDVISQTMGTVIGIVLGGACGFWLGQVYQQSNRRSSDQSQQGGNP